MKNGANAANAKSAIAYAVFRPTRPSGRLWQVRRNAARKAIEGLHDNVESRIAGFANRENRAAGRLSAGVTFRTSTPPRIAPDR